MGPLLGALAAQLCIWTTGPISAQELSTGFVTPSVVVRRLLILGSTCKEMRQIAIMYGVTLLAPKASRIACSYILADKWFPPHPIDVLQESLSQLPSPELEALKASFPWIHNGIYSYMHDYCLNAMTNRLPTLTQRMGRQ